MALSLADELAGFDDGPNPFAGTLSLAEEFGTEEPLGVKGISLGDELQKQYHLSRTMSPDSPLGGPSLISVRNSADRNVSRLPRAMKPSEDGYRSAKSSSSTMTVMSHNLDDLENETFFTDAGTSYHTALSSLSGPSSPSAGAGQMLLEKDANDSPYHAEDSTMRARDPLDELQQILHANDRFLGLLKREDRPAPIILNGESSFYDMESPVQGDALLGDLVEIKMQRLLDKVRLENAEREDQCRRLSHLVREFVRLGGDVTFNLEIDLALFAGSAGMETMSEEQEVEAVSTMSFISPSSPTSTVGPTPLGTSMCYVVDATAALIMSLHILLEGLHNTSSFSTSISRQVRGIKASAESMSEMRDKEEEVRRFVENYERAQLEQGLRGDHNDLKSELEDLCRGFDEVLGSSGRKMRAVRESITGCATAAL